MASKFHPRSPADVERLIDGHPLAWLVSRDFRATPLPLLAETNESGEIVSLLGHIARRNPQFASLEADPRALILFSGPHGYISPRLVSDRSWGPTWNYAVARFEVELEFIPEETGHALERLAAHLESDGWTTDEMGERYDMLIGHIIAFRAHILSADPRFKLGQDERPGVFNEIVNGLGDDALADWMKEQVKD